MDIIIRNRQPHHKDPDKDVFSVWVKDHPTCKPGLPRRVAYTGVKVDAEVGHVLWIAEHQLHKAEMKQVFQAVKDWQANPEAIAKSRADKEVTL